MLLCNTAGITVIVATRYGLDNQFESHQGQEFSLLHVIQTDSAANPAPYPMGNSGSFPRGKTRGT